MIQANISLQRRRFGITAAIGAGSIPLGMWSQTQAAGHTHTTEKGLVVSMGAKAGATHTIVTFNDGRVTIQLLEGPKGIVIVDSGDAPDYAQAAVALAKSLKKPIEAVFLSHDHPDHTGGLPSYSGLPIMTTSGILANIKNGPFPKPSNIDQVKVFDGEQIEVAGLNLIIHTIKNAEALEQIVLEAPDLDTTVVQDLVYNNCYLFPGMDRPGWIDALESLQTKLSTQNLLVGHGYPTSLGELSSAVDYLNEYQTLIAASSDGDDLAARVKARWPNHLGEGLLGLQGFAFAG